MRGALAVAGPRLVGVQGVPDQPGRDNVSREVRKLGFRKLSARPQHYAQSEPAMADFKNVWPAPSASGFLR